MVNLYGPLMKACIYGKFDDVQRLLKQGAKPEITRGLSPLHSAIIRSNKELHIYLPIIHLLLYHGAPINQIDRYRTALEEASTSDKKVRDALSAKFAELYQATGKAKIIAANENTDEKAYKELIQASIDGRIEDVRKLLESGVKPIKKEGTAPLFEAILRSDKGEPEEKQQLIQLLVDYGAPINEVVGTQTALQTAAKVNNAFAFKILSEAAKDYAKK